ncbi:MAG: flagellar hook-associated protein FlgK [Phycisphaeraceae bacterium]|nr:flagellar hook-associated protein FlgK [Phycisphaeraceae bacterium]
MSGSFSIGRSGLAASQLGMNITGNNIANANTPGFSRQRVDLAPSANQLQGRLRIGNGVDVQGIRRLTDQALQQRLLASTSAESAASTNSSLLGGIEEIAGKLDAQGRLELNNEVNAFFDAWSSLGSNNPTTTRSTVVARGSALASYLRTLRGQINSQTGTIDAQLSAAATSTDSLLREVARLNTQIVNAGSSAAASLQDQRDGVLAKLANLVDITTAPQDNGTVNVYVGSTMLVDAGTYRGVKIDTRTVGTEQVVVLATADNGEVIGAKGGRVAALLQQRGTSVQEALDRLDRLASELIHEVNRVYSQGSALTAVRSYTGATRVAAPDRPLAFNDPTNATFAALTHRPTSGAITLRVASDSSGTFNDVNIPIDLNGLTNAGTPGFADDTSLDDLAAAINALPNLSATITPEGQLRINAAAGHTLSIVSDTSGVLTSLGINTYFAGNDASDIAVRSDLAADPSTLSVRAIVGGIPTDNGVSNAIIGLRTKAIANLQGNTLLGDWSAYAQELGVQVASAETATDTANAVTENLTSQLNAVSGVSLDEEAINLVLFQTQYQASARYISVLQQMTDTLMRMV